jgi:hypothetical protein
VSHSCGTRAAAPTPAAQALTKYKYKGFGVVKEGWCGRQSVRARRDGSGVCGLRKPLPDRCGACGGRARWAGSKQRNATPHVASHRTHASFPRKMSASKGDSIPSSPTANSFYTCAQACACEQLLRPPPPPPSACLCAARLLTPAQCSRCRQSMSRWCKRVRSPCASDTGICLPALSRISALLMPCCRGRHGCNRRLHGGE